MFGQVLDKVDTYFGRAFLLARFVPWLLCIAANLVIASVEFPAVRSFVASEYADLSTSAANKALDLALALLAVCAVAYITTPLIQYITKFLEGAWIPSWLAQLLVIPHAHRRDELEREVNSLFARRDEMRGSADVIEGLKQDRAIGARLRAIGDREALGEAHSQMQELRARRWLNRPVAPDDFRRAERALSKALRRNCAEVTLLADQADAEEARSLQALHEEMWRTIVPYAFDIVEQLENRALAERQRLFASNDLAPTRLGNDAASLRSYCITRYGLDFDFFWPRYLLVVQKDAKLSDAIATAKIQLDFSVLALTLTTASTLVWSGVLAIWGSSPSAAFLVFALGPLTARSWLGIVHASYSSFADLARGVVDLYRFDLLNALHRPLPISTNEEKQIWEMVARLVLLDEHRDNVTFRHPTT